MSAIESTPPRPRDASADRAVAQARLASRNGRVRRIRRRVIATAAVTFAVAWAAIFVQLVEGHDPGLASSRNTTTSSTNASGSSPTSPKSTSPAVTSGSSGSSSSGSGSATTSGSSGASNAQSSASPSTSSSSGSTGSGSPVSPVTTSQS